MTDDEGLPHVPDNIASHLAVACCSWFVSFVDLSCISMLHLLLCPRQDGDNVTGSSTSQVVRFRVCTYVVRSSCMHDLGGDGSESDGVLFLSNHTRKELSGADDDHHAFFGEGRMAESEWERD